MNTPDASSEDPDPRSPRGLGPSHPWRRRRKFVLTIVALLVLALVVWRLVSAPGGKRSEESNIVSVVTATARQGPFTVYQSALGTVTSLGRVAVRSRITGRLVSVTFNGGELVKRGTLLATIDPQPFQIKLDSAAGELARDKASSANIADTLTRYRQLLAEKSITSQQVADQEALARKNTADVRVAQSRVADAKLQLAHTRITAPVDGMVGLPRVDPGNIVDASDPDGITTVTQLHPISVVFAVPDDALAGLVGRLQAGDTIPVTVYRPGTETRLAGGDLLAVNNEIDPDTGTVKLKAKFANTKGMLFPNQFVTVKLPVQTLSRAVIVPTAAIRHGQDRTFVFVVGKNHKISIADVKPGPSDDTSTVVESGVAAGTVVVIEGADQLGDGMRVQIVAAPAMTLSSTAVPSMAVPLTVVPSMTAGQTGKAASASAGNHAAAPDAQRTSLTGR